MVPTNIIHNKSVKYPLQPFLEKNDMLSFSNIIFQCFEHHKYSIYFHHMWVAGRNHRDISKLQQIKLYSTPLGEKITFQNEEY